MNDRVETLSHCRVLKSFSEVGLRLLAQSVRERVYPRAQIIQRQGEEPRNPAVLFVSMGSLRCEVRNREGENFVLGSLSAGDHLGGMRLLESSVAPMTVIAESEVVTLELERPAFQRLQRERPNTAIKLLYSLAADFGKSVGEAGEVLADFAIYAGIRANLEERGTFSSYQDLGLDLTPTVQRMRGDY